MAEWVEIDGSYGEGGGQILRTSLALSALTGRPLRITNIRAGRPKPGLAAQHLTAVRAAAAVCSADVAGDHFGSKGVEFRPGRVGRGSWEFDVAAERGSAGATSLVLQAVLPAVLVGAGEGSITVHGGTNVPWSPSFEYLLHVFAPCLRLMGAELELDRPRAGFYPHGGGTIKARARLDGRLQPLQLAERGALGEIIIHSVTSDRLPAHIGRRQVEGCRRGLGAFADEAGRLRTVDERPPSGGPGTAVLAAARAAGGMAGFTAIGRRGRPAERVGREAGEQLAQFLRTGAALDERLSDQILIYAALADGPSTWTTPRITEHFQTNAYVIRQFVAVSIEWEEEMPERWRVSVSPRA